MPNKPSAIKALRQSKRRAERNDAVRGSLSYEKRMVRKAIEANDSSKADELSKGLVKLIDKAVQKKVLKPNTGSRMKSRLMKKVNSTKQA